MTRSVAGARLFAAHESSEANLVDLVEVFLLETSEVAAVDLIEVTLDHLGLQVARTAPAVDFGQLERHLGHSGSQNEAGKN